MPSSDVIETLIARGVLTREIAQRATSSPPGGPTSYTGRLVAAGADARRLFDELARISGIPVAGPDVLERPVAVHLLHSTAHQLRDALACPVRRDPHGVLHVLITDPDTNALLDKLLVNFQAHLAPEARVRELLQRLYSLGSGAQGGGAADAAEAIEIDLEASRRHVRAPAKEELAAIDIDLEASLRMTAAPGRPATPAASPAPAPAPPAPAPARAPRPAPPWPARAPDEEETMRIQRAPRPQQPAAATPEPAGQGPMVSVLDEKTIEDAIPPALVATVRSATRRAFVQGLVLGASIAAAVAAVVIAALLSR